MIGEERLKRAYDEYMNPGAEKAEKMESELAKKTKWKRRT